MRKYFLVLAFLCIIQPICAMESKSRTPWTFRSMYTKITNCLPTFSFSSFAKFFNFNFKIRKEDNQQAEIIPEQNNVIENQNNSINIIDSSKKALRYMSSSATSFVHSIKIIPFIALINTANRHKFEEDYLERIRKYPKGTLEAVYLENFFQKYPEHAKKFKQHELNSNLADAVKAAEKYKFKHKSDWKSIKECITQGASSDYPVGYFGESLLMLTVECQQKELFCFLLQSGANVNFQNKNGRTALHTATWQNNCHSTEFIESLIQHGANVDILNQYKESPLFLAIYHENVNAIKSLIEHKANIYQADAEGITPLENALEYEKGKAPNIVTLLYKNATSLTNIGLLSNSIFHYPVEIQNSKLLTMHIRTIIKYTQDAYKEEDLESKKRFLETYKILGLVKNSPPDEIRCLILSMLPENHFFSTTNTENKKIEEREDVIILKNLIKTDARNFKILYRIMQQMVRIEKALMHKNKNNKTPLEALNAKYNKLILDSKDNQQNINEISNYVTLISPLFKESRPKEDLAKLLEVFPKVPEPDDNWAEAACFHLLFTGNK